LQFAETKPIPSYLVALTVGRWDVVDAGTAARITHRAHHRAARVAGGSAIRQREDRADLTQLENYFGIAYPYEKLRLRDIPGLHGAMEIQGWSPSRQRLLLSVPEKGRRVRFHHAYIDVATHEFAPKVR